MINDRDDLPELPVKDSPAGESANIIRTGTVNNSHPNRSPPCPYFERASEFDIHGGQFTDIEISGNVFWVGSTPILNKVSSFIIP